MTQRSIIVELVLFVAIFLLTTALPPLLMSIYLPDFAGPALVDRMYLGAFLISFPTNTFGTTIAALLVRHGAFDSTTAMALSLTLSAVRIALVFSLFQYIRTRLFDDQ